MNIVKELKKSNCNMCKKEYNSCYIYARLYAFNVADMLDIGSDCIKCKELDKVEDIEYIQEECI